MFFTKCTIFVIFNNITKWLNTNITESSVTDLVNDLAACEKVTNKNSINGYCGLINGFINIVNIPNLPESLITTLTSDLSNKADLVSGYLKSCEIPLSVPLTINSLSTSNNILNLTTDNIPQGITNNYAVYPIPISDISSFTITNPSTGQFLYYNGSQWINQNITEINVSNLNIRFIKL